MNEWMGKKRRWKERKNERKREIGNLQAARFESVAVTVAVDANVRVRMHTTAQRLI